MKFVKGLMLLCAMVISSSAFAQDAGGATGGKGGLVAFSVAVLMGLAVIGGALGQGKAASTALEGIARNPEASGKIMTPMIIALALIESLVIYGLIVAFMMVGKI